MSWILFFYSVSSFEDTQFVIQFVSGQRCFYQIMLTLLEMILFWPFSQIVFSAKMKNIYFLGTNLWLWLTVNYKFLQLPVFKVIPNCPYMAATLLLLFLRRLDSKAAACVRVCVSISDLMAEVLSHQVLYFLASSTLFLLYNLL